MNNLLTTTGIYFAQPLWLILLVLWIPVIMLGRRNMKALSPVRRWLAIGLRCLGILVLICMLARMKRTEQSEDVTVVAVVDRSLSIPQPLQESALDYLDRALPETLYKQRWAVVDCAESATIARLPSADPNVPRRNTTLHGGQTNLERGVQLALAIAPPDTGVRLCLISEGNQTVGDLREAARIASVNRIPIDVLPLRYKHEREVVFRHVAAPAQARSRETIPLRFIIESTQAATGEIQLFLNGQAVDLEPDSDQLGSVVQLKEGTNVKTVSVPLGTRGTHEFKAVFIPSETGADQIQANNQANALTVVAGPGHILVVQGPESAPVDDLVQALREAQLDVRLIAAAELPGSLNRLIDADAIVLADVDAGQFSFQQMEMLERYVTELGGGLVVAGGPNSFGAGGWIGSPVAEILPVDLDPPQKKELPKGALVLIMHACEMPQGNYWGKKVATSAIKTLSRQDIVGVMAYNYRGGDQWVYPLSEVGDKSTVIRSIDLMQMGDLPDLHSHLQLAYDSLMKVNAGQRHVIVISDGDPSPPSLALLKQMKEAKITCTGVAVFPHNQMNIDGFRRMAQRTGGRYYLAMDPGALPKIFVKEARMVKRSLIIEESFQPKLAYGLSETMQGLDSVPNLDGYVLTGPKGGLAQVVLASDKDDPILATTQAGLGRCVAFTSSADKRWAAPWHAWGGYAQFWEQVVRWAAKPQQDRDCEVMVDVQGRQVDVHVETVDHGGAFMPLAGVEAAVIGPDMKIERLPLKQSGAGSYQASFGAQQAGSYLVNVRYKRPGQEKSVGQVQASVTVPFAPEFADLRDNAALLSEVSALTKGRILTDDPMAANLFDPTGVKFPRTQHPLTVSLTWIWLALFLLDIATRRLSLDLVAMQRRWRQWFRTRRQPAEAGTTLSQLKRTRKQIQQARTGPGQRAQASKRYQAEATAEGDLPVASSHTKPPSAEARPEAPKTQAKPTKTDDKAPSSHIDQLLKAKRKAKERDS